jgi:glycosyltransferase involved in cell wall biosynthesis
VQKVAHLTSVHTPFDTRILHKECQTLAGAGYDVVLIAPCERDAEVGGVRIRAVAKPRNRLERMVRTGWQIYRAGLNENAALYHFHDPELIPQALLLRLHGKPVIYDVHEDDAAALRQKAYVPGLVRRPLASIVGFLERLTSRAFHLVLAEQYYERQFPRGIPILNYPIIDEDAAAQAVVRHDEPPQIRLLYTGTVTVQRGALLHAAIVNLLPTAHVHIIGRCDPKLAEAMLNVAGENATRLHIEGEGCHVPYERILAAYKEGGWSAGLALFPPSMHYLEKQLTKFFEYMMYGIPIVCSDFPSWRALMNETGAGLCVDAEAPNDVAGAISWLVDHPQEAEAMGQRGRDAVRSRYNWDVEGKKLVALYGELLER